MPPSIDQVPQSPYSSILNFRDVGETINILSGKRILKSAALFRSAEPDFSTPSERCALTTDHHIHTIIDLRSKTEHIEAAKKLSANPPPSSAAVPQSTEQTAKPLELDAPRTEAISLTGSAFERTLLWRLKWGSMGRLVYHMARGQRLEGISILGHEVMSPRGLLGLASDTLASSTSEVRNVFSILSQSTSYPLLFHCTQGKDRTGLVAILVLLLCGVDVSVIEADYRASERELQAGREDKIAYMSKIGLTEEFALCPEGFVEGVVEFLEKGWGGVDGYLESVGVGEKMRADVRANLMNV